MSFLHKDGIYTDIDQSFITVETQELINQFPHSFTIFSHMIIVFIANAIDVLEETNVLDNVPFITFHIQTQEIDVSYSGSAYHIIKTDTRFEQLACIRDHGDIAIGLIFDKSHQSGLGY